MTSIQKHALPVPRVGVPRAIQFRDAEVGTNFNRYFALKHWPMRVLGAVLLVAALPVLLALVALVRVTSRGPGIYCQERTGRNGRKFVLYKLRSMYVDAERTTGPIWSRPGDSRVTPLGRVLRFLHLDELPQLVNVVRGEMCLVGPRPERPEIIERLQREVPNYNKRHQVLPGITGLAQINVPPDVNLNTVRAKVVLDIEYIRTASLGLDAGLLCCTVLRVVSVYGTKVPRVLGLRREVYSVIGSQTSDAA